MKEQPDASTDIREDRRMMALAEVAEYLRVHKIPTYSAIKAGDNLGQLRIRRLWRSSRQSIVRYAVEEASLKTRDQSRVGFK
jgi:hypothetical protein